MNRAMGLHKPLWDMFSVPSGRDGGSVPTSQSQKSQNLQLRDSCHDAVSGKFHWDDRSQYKHRLTKNKAGGYLRVVDRRCMQNGRNLVESGLLPKLSP